MKKLVFLNSHPIQYFGPLYAFIQEKKYFELEVWYCSKHGLKADFDPEFNQSIKWDIPILDGYNSVFLNNISFTPGIFKGFFGLINFGVIKRIYHLPKGSVIIVHGWSYFTAVLTIICARILGYEICLRAESPLIHEKGKSVMMKRLRKIILKNFLFKLPTKFLYIGKENMEFYRQFGVSENKFIFTPYCVNNEYFQKSYHEFQFQKKKIKEDIGVPSGTKVVLFSGKLIKKKHPMDLLLSYESLCHRESVYLIFVGEGSERSSLTHYINEKGLKNVIITGFVNQSEISKFYSIADLFVMCSDYGETWGLSTNEAMNFELPILVSNRTGCSVDLVNGNGFMFKTRDTNDLTRKMSYLLKLDDADIRSMGIRSKKIIEEYSYQTIANNLKVGLSE